MSDHLDRAAEVIAAQMHGLTTPSMCREIARALEEAGMLVSPERDADDRRHVTDYGWCAGYLENAATISFHPDERGRVTDEALVVELVRRGVLTEDDGGPCDTDARTHAVNCSCFGGPQRQRRYVTEWEPVEEDA